MTLTMKRIFPLLLILLPTIAYASGNESGNSFRKAKNILLQRVYFDHRTTFYAACSFDMQKLIGMSSCGLVPRKRPKRAARVELEHVMPAWEMGHQLQCWHRQGKYSARKNCRRNSLLFKRMESDMHNLRPSDGELNADRSNYRYGIIKGEPRAYGSMVDFEVNFKRRVAEPRPEVRGDIARTYFYMAEEYGIRIGRKQKQLFDAWNKQDPIDGWERERNCKIAKLQGNSNLFIGLCH